MCFLQQSLPQLEFDQDQNFFQVEHLAVVVDAALLTVVVVVALLAVVVVALLVVCGSGLLWASHPVESGDCVEPGTAAVYFCPIRLMLVFVLMLVAECAALLSGFVCPPTVVAAFVVVLSRLFDLVAELHLIAADVVVVVVVRPVPLLVPLHIFHSFVFVDLA